MEIENECENLPIFLKTKLICSSASSIFSSKFITKLKNSYANLNGHSLMEKQFKREEFNVLFPFGHKIIITFGSLQLLQRIYEIYNISQLSTLFGRDLDQLNTTLLNDVEFFKKKVVDNNDDFIPLQNLDYIQYLLILCEIADELNCSEIKPILVQAFEMLLQNAPIEKLPSIMNSFIDTKHETQKQNYYANMFQHLKQ